MNSLTNPKFKYTNKTIIYMINVVLVEPKNSGNIGAIARVMKNFELKNLVLVNPKVSHLSQTARNRAKHAQDILKKAKIVKKIPKFDCLIATTAKLGTDYNIKRSPLTPEQVRDKIKINKKVGLLIGPEGNGLTNKQVMDSDFVVSIPSSKKYPTLNISHACAILFYELFKGEKNSTDHINFASAKDKEILLSFIAKRLNKMEFATKEKKQTQKIVWKRVIGKCFLTKREAFALIGFFKKIK